MRQHDDFLDAITYAYKAYLPTMNAHVFYFKYPRIKVDLVHEELGRWWPSSQGFPSKHPNGAYVYSDGEWWQQTAVHNHKKVQEIHVPKEIRLHLLLIT